MSPSLNTKGVNLATQEKEGGDGLVTFNESPLIIFVGLSLPLDIQQNVEYSKNISYYSLYMQKEQINCGMKGCSHC